MLVFYFLLEALFFIVEGEMNLSLGGCLLLFDDNVTIAV